MRSLSDKWINLSKEDRAGCQLLRTNAARVWQDAPLSSWRDPQLRRATIARGPELSKNFLPLDIDKW
jgi:hypothetical protein